MLAAPTTKTTSDSAAPAPPPDCPLCPRLKAFRDQWRALEPDWHNAPVPAFGPRDASLVIVGLAPGLRGANRTGRPFTGDYAGDLLYSTLLKYGFATGQFEARPDDSLRLVGTRIVNAVRCVPPENKPTGPEITTCRTFLSGDFAWGSPPRAIVTLGRIAHDSTVRALGGKLRAAPFGHGAAADLAGVRLISSYHCSRYNTNTGVLTEAMFHAVFGAARNFLDGAG